MNEEQGTQAADEVNKVEDEFSNTEEQLESDSESTQVDDAAQEEEETEVDYKTSYEKAKIEAQKKQDKVNKQRAALSQSNRKIEELQAKLNELQGPAQDEKPLVKPNINDFETNEEYQKAIDEYTDAVAAKKIKESQKEQLLEQQKAEIEKRNNEQKAEFLKSEAAYRLVNPDYDRAKTELQEHIELNPVKDAVADAIYERASKGGMLPAIINYFGENSGERLSEFSKISEMSPYDAVVEIYKIQQKLKSMTSPKDKPLPKPIKAVKSTGTGGKSLDKASGKDVLDWVNS